MRTSTNFDPQDQSEVETFGIDFVNDMPAADSIASCSMTISLIGGYDPNPAARLIGPTTFDGTLVSTWIAGCLPGCTYELSATIQTTLSRTITLYSLIPPDPNM